MCILEIQLNNNNKNNNSDFRRQEDVSDHPSLLLRGGSGIQVYRLDGYRPGGQQAVPVRLSPLLVAGRRESRPASSRQVNKSVFM